jgi:hypothetical protein
MDGGGGGSEYVKLLYVIAEHRIQNSYRIQRLMYRYMKLLMYRALFFIWRLDLMILMQPASYERQVH